MINIYTVEGAGTDEFSEYIRKNVNTLVYSEPRFLKLVSEHLGARCYWNIAKKDDVITGLLPYLVKDGPLGPVFNSLAYYGSNGGVIQIKSDNSSKVALVDSFYRSAKHAQAVSATIISNPLERDSEFYTTHTRYDFCDERIGLITHLPNNCEDLMSSFDNPRPRNIRRAIKEGVTVQKGGVEALDFLYRTHVDNLTAIGGIAKDRSFFSAIPKTMHSDDWAVFTAYLNGEPIAALLLFYYNGTVEYFTPVIVESRRSTQALALVIYESMMDAIQMKYINWNWGGTWLTQDGVYDFKKRWGASEYRYYYYTRVMNQKLRLCTQTFLAKHYAGFFLIPFNKLSSTQEVQID